MATKSRFRKLTLGPSEPLTRRNSVQGMLVIADYLDPENNQRTLLLERRDAASAPSRKRKANREPEPKKEVPVDQRPV